MDAACQVDVIPAATMRPACGPSLAAGFSLPGLLCQQPLPVLRVSGRDSKVAGFDRATCINDWWGRWGYGRITLLKEQSLVAACDRQWWWSASA